MVVEKNISSRTISNLRSSTNWQENVLSNLDNYNYYVKFFITDLRTHIRYLNEGYNAFLRDDAQIYTIAETATTEFNIDNIEIAGKVLPNEVTGFSTATTFTFTIKEPGGLTLIDRLIIAARKLGLRNWAKMPYFLEISFKGYDENGAPTRIISNSLTNTRWVFRLVVRNVTTSLDTSGTIYNFDAVTFNEYGLNDSLQALMNSVTVKGRTIREILNNYIEEKRKQEINHYGEDRNLYSIRILPLPRFFGEIVGFSNLDIGNWKITGNPYKNQIRKESTKDTETKEIVLPKGETIENLIKELFVNTDEGQKILMRNKSGTEKPSADMEEIAYPWIEVKTSIREDKPYSHKNNIYNYSVEYIIVPQINYLGIGSKKQLEALETQNRSKMVEKIRTIIDKGRLRKKYEYIFTGLNTEVLDFNLQFDYLYKAILPLFDGNATFDVSTNTVIEQEKNVARKTYSGDIFADPVLEKEISSQLDQLFNDPENRNIFGFSVPDNQKNKNIPNISRNSQQPETRIRKQTKKLFVEDILLSDTENLDFDLPITIDKTVRTDSTSYGKFIETVNPNKKAFSVAILEQVVSRNLIEIDLTIRGDPYWLGVPRDVPALNGRLEDWLEIEPDKNKELALYSTGVETLLLTFKVPTGIDDDGNIILKSKNVFNGIYNVVEVKHSFSRGEFKQTLKCRRIPDIDVNILLDELEKPLTEREHLNDVLLNQSSSSSLA